MHKQETRQSIAALQPMQIKSIFYIAQKRRDSDLC